MIKKYCVFRFHDQEVLVVITNHHSYRHHPRPPHRPHHRCHSSELKQNTCIIICFDFIM